MVSSKFLFNNLFFFAQVNDDKYSNGIVLYTI